MQPTIDIQHLCHRYGKTEVLHNLSFTVEKGQIVGFLGPNGAGKSTTMRILCGLMTAASGRVYVCGHPVSTHSQEVKRRIGYMPENNPLPEDMRVVEYLIYRGRLKEIPRKKLQPRVNEVMELCDLNRTARKKIIGTLSKGFRQRVGIADTLLAEPELIIMDEPTIGLDPHQVIIIRDLINSLKGKMSVIFSSHILSEVEMACDKVVIINQGRIVAHGTADELRETFIPEGINIVTIKGPKNEIESCFKAMSKHIRYFDIHPIEEDIYRVQFQADSIEFVRHGVSAALRNYENWTLCGFSQTQASLEDIFLEATKRSWDVLYTPKNKQSQTTQII